MKLDFSVFDSLLEPCVVINREHQVLYCNETASVIFDVPVRKVMRQKMPLESLLEFQEEFRGFTELENISGPTPVEEVSVKSIATSQHFKIQISAQPIESLEDEKLWLLYIRDVTLEEKLQIKYKGELSQKESIINDLKESKKIIEDYSLNLENKVKERTQELSELNQTLTALLDSLNQGFFIFDKKGLCLPVYSKACEIILEGAPEGKHFADILNFEGEERIKIQEWVDFLYDETLPFEEAILFGPTLRKHSQGNHIELTYCPIFGADNKLINVVVVATDTTLLIEARNAAEFEKNQAKLILNILRNRKQVHNFIEDCKLIIKGLRDEIEKPAVFREHGDMFRGLHTLKGGSASIGILELSEHCHLAENILSDIRLHEEISSEFGEKWARLENLIHQINEDFIKFLDNTSQLIGRSLTKERLLEISYFKFVNVIHNPKISVFTDDVRDILIEEFLMEPVVELIKGYQDTILALAEELGKQLLPLEITNGHIKILPDNYKNLFGSLVHIFRNAIDHGIETPEQRLAKGKLGVGKIAIGFSVLDQKLRIIIRDDGAGIDPQSVIAKLLKSGIDVAVETDEQIIQHVFDAGFSTKQQVTSISGRGVGMDAVMQAAVEIGGTARVMSRINEGTIFIIEVPYNRKIINFNSDAFPIKSVL